MVGNANNPNLDAILVVIAAEMRAFSEIPGIAPPAGFRATGQKVPRQPSRCSGRTAMTAHLDVHELKPPDDPDAPLSFSMEGYPNQPPSALIPRFWAPQWNSAQAINKFQIEVGGPLHGGDPGRRLIEPVKNAALAYLTGVPDAFVARAGEWLILPACHIYGSDELSVSSPGVAQRSPKPYLVLNQKDMDGLGLKEGQAVSVSVANQVHTFAVKGRHALPVGVALLPVGLPGLPVIDLPAWGRISVEGKT